MDLCDIKLHLIKLDYPNISVKSDEEVADIFQSKNILFFTRWAVEKLEVANIPTEDAKAEIYLADVIHSYGFCTSSQKLPFIRGDTTLPINIQLTIIVRILKYLYAIKRISKESIFDNKKLSSMPGEELKRVVSQQINLFTTLGPVKTISNNERLTKLTTARAKLLSLKAEIESLKNLTGQAVSEEVNEPNFSNLKSCSGLFKSTAKTLNGISNYKGNGMRFSSEIEGVIAECNLLSKLLSRHVNNVNGLNENTSVDVKQAAVRNKSILEQIEQLSHMSTELTNMLGKFDFSKI